MDEGLKVDLTLGQIAAYFDDGTTPDELDEALNEAQDLVNSGKQESATILTTIKKE